MAREALLAAMKAQAGRADAVRQAAAEIGGTQDAKPTGVQFERELGKQIEGIDQQIKKVEDLPQDLLSGRIDDFHEVAVQIKKAEFSFRFAMEIRNKLVEAYREVMRMNV